MTRDGITINELSKMANVTVRTIRFYTDEGVLDEPSGRDRYARYTRRHYLQLNTARALKERFYPLRVIRDKMASMTDAELEQLGGPVPAHIEARFAEAYVPELVAEHIDMSYVPIVEAPTTRSVVDSMVYHSVPNPMQSFQANSEVSHTMPTPVPPSRSAVRLSNTVGDVWHRITVAPGIELHVRDDAMQDSAGDIRRIMASMRKR